MATDSKKTSSPVPGISWSTLTDNERNIVKHFVHFVDEKTKGISKLERNMEDVWESAAHARAAHAELERRVDSCLTVQDLHKLNVGMSVLEEQVNEIAAHVGLGSKNKNQAEVIELLQRAKQRVALQQSKSAPQAIADVSPADSVLYEKALLAMYLGVTSIWTLSAGEPAVLTAAVLRQLLHEWHDGMVTHQEDILLAFDVAIKREALR